MVSERVIPVGLAPQHELVRAWLASVHREAFPSIPEWTGDISAQGPVTCRIVAPPESPPRRVSQQVRAWLWTTEGRPWLVAGPLSDQPTRIPDLAVIRPGAQATVRGDRPGGRWWWDVDPWLSPVVVCTLAAHGRALRLEGRMGWAETVAAVEQAQGPGSVSIAVRVGIDEEMAFGLIADLGRALDG